VQEIPARDCNKNKGYLHAASLLSSKKTLRFVVAADLSVSLVRFLWLLEVARLDPSESELQSFE